MAGMATPKADECPQCSAAAKLRGVSTVAEQPEDFKLTYRCQECGHEWTVIKPALWITDDNG